jgi:hypothetical protein
MSDTPEETKPEVTEQEAADKATKSTAEASPKQKIKPRRILAFAAVGIVGGLGLGTGVNWVMQPDPVVMRNSAPLTHPQAGSMQAALEALGSTEGFKTLTVGDGIIDIVFTGAPECPHCKVFVEDGLDAFVEKAQAGGFDAVYVPLAMSPIGHSLASIDACISGEDVPTGAARIKQIYAQEALLQTQAEELAKAPESDKRKAMLDLIRATATDLGAGEEGVDFECYVGSAKAFQAESSLFAQTFEVKFTPSFFFEDPETGLTGFSGYNDLEWMFGRLNAK